MPQRHKTNAGKPAERQRVTHEIKIEQKYLLRIIKEEKLFEVRNNDRDYQVGDILHFLPLESSIVNVYKEEKVIPYYKITYVHHGRGMQDGYVILGIRQTNN